MQKRLSLRNLMFIGSMLFGLFFGAGNLIFPVFLGQQAGSNVWLAVIGLLITGIGLPLLGVAGLGITESASVFDLAKKVNRSYAYIFTVLLYLIIGPLFATPRLATTSFQMGIVPFVSNGQQALVLAIFSILFFAASWWFARKPSKIMTYVGKWLTPIFLILLGILIAVALIHPMGSLTAQPQGQYVHSPVLAGFTEGYNTMDALASLAFGVVVIDGIKMLGITDPKAIATDTIKAGAISVVLMGIIYTLLALLGAMSLGHLKLAANGGITLAQIFNYYFGSFGNVLLALIVIVACLKTSIGLITAFGEAMHEMFPKISYQVLIAIASILPCIFANVGLTNLIQYSTPALMFIYPLAITLIILAILTPFIGSSKWIFGVTTLFTLIPAILAGLEALSFVFKGQGWFTTLMHFNDVLPLASLGLGWVVPALIGLVVGYVISRFRPTV
ncbi:branched-chain amino acid transport system II carrier protein [Companilactobacillus ginsenosidimutans]|uniref:Branched-chain amino acid transport system carrier protein n=1 Tax=Companilactobacillus ginsenosidimutans TaxID=1007676 RepID=A0A0H4QN29_9LACO|nr:branched-chain amino acid transport system II carrier protein [Companilactobacillus ginsenosidimutans]AKP68148.1 branched-chain amino acid transporter II carrier protein [Companilactobacillus ginsenosidimutans]